MIVGRVVLVMLVDVSRVDDAGRDTESGDLNGDDVDDDNGDNVRDNLEEWKLRKDREMGVRGMQQASGEIVGGIFQVIVGSSIYYSCLLDSVFWCLMRCGPHLILVIGMIPIANYEPIYRL